MNVSRQLGRSLVAPRLQRYDTFRLGSRRTLYTSLERSNLRLKCAHCESPMQHIYAPFQLLANQSCPCIRDGPRSGNRHCDYPLKSSSQPLALPLACAPLPDAARRHSYFIRPWQQIHPSTECQRCLSPFLFPLSSFPFRVQTDAATGPRLSPPPLPCSLRKGSQDLLLPLLLMTQLSTDSPRAWPTSRPVRSNPWSVSCSSPATRESESHGLHIVWAPPLLKKRRNGSTLRVLTQSAGFRSEFHCPALLNCGHGLGCRCPAHLLGWLTSAIGALPRWH